jgi:hypothetical protein
MKLKDKIINELIMIELSKTLNVELKNEDIIVIQEDVELTANVRIEKILINIKNKYVIIYNELSLSGNSYNFVYKIYSLEQDALEDYPKITSCDI